MILCLIMGVLTYCGNSNTAILIPQYSTNDVEAMAQTYLRAEQGRSNSGAAVTTPQCEIGMRVYDAQCVMRYGNAPQCVSKCAR